MRAGREWLARRSGGTRLARFDDVGDVPAALHRLSGFIGRPLEPADALGNRLELPSP